MPGVRDYPSVEAESQQLRASSIGGVITPCIFKKIHLAQAILLLLWTSNVNDIETKAQKFGYQSFFWGR
jgi:hypothetical protein